MYNCNWRQKKLKKNKAAAIHIYSNFSLILLLFLFQSKALPWNIEKYFGWFLCLSFYPEIYLCKHQNIRMNYFFWYYVQDFLWLVNGLNGQKVVAIEAQFRQFRNMMVNKILLNGNRKNVYFAVRINLPHLFCHVILGFFFPLLKWILFLEEDLAWMVFCVDFRVRWRQHKVQGRKYSMRIQSHKENLINRSKKKGTGADIGWEGRRWIKSIKKLRHRPPWNTFYFSSHVGHL